VLLSCSSEKPEKETRGIPNDWEEFYVKQIWSDSFQVTYQDYIKRGFNKTKFDADFKGWTINLIKENFLKN
tara:strand:- start:236 stop:448 length:213 start_codon:yes stop_codon:yes gene_type:complete